MRFFSLLLTALITANPAWTQTNAVSPPGVDPQAALRVRVLDDPQPVLPDSTAIKGYAVQVTDSSGAPVGDAAVALRLPEDGPTGHFAGNLRAWIAYTDSAGVARFPVIEWEGSIGLAVLRITAAKGSAHTGLLVEQRIGAEHASSLLSPSLAAAKASAPPLPRAPEIITETPKPGTLALADTIPMTASKSGAAIPAGPALKPGPPPTAQTQEPAREPAVSITNSGTGAGSHGRRKTWLIVAAVGAAAGVGALLALHGHGGGSSPASSLGVAIGTPTITVGH
jgi:hypothetical protein